MISRMRWGGVDDQTPLFIIITVSVEGHLFFIRIILTAGHKTPTRHPSVNSLNIKYYYCVWEGWRMAYRFL